MKKGQVILIVDDNLNFVDRMINLLEEEANISHTIIATDFEETRIQFDLEQPDVVLLDINLPGKNGIEVLKFIRDKDIKCEVIMITNHFDEYYRQQCFDLGAKHFIDKSNDFGRVPAIIRESGLVE
jgi:DNA-binding NarL/FixJ family response regulator